MREPLLQFLIALLLLRAIGAIGGEFVGEYSKLSGIIIPGFASTQLRAWSILDCPYSPLDFNPLDLVWLDTTKVKKQTLALILSIDLWIVNQLLEFFFSFFFCCCCGFWLMGFAATFCCELLA